MGINVDCPKHIQMTEITDWYPLAIQKNFLRRKSCQYMAGINSNSQLIRILEEPYMSSQSKQISIKQYNKNLVGMIIY